MSFSNSDGREPYPLSAQLKRAAGRVLKRAWRTLQIGVAVLAMAWTGAFIMGCRGLETALDSVNSNPSLSFTVPKNWEHPAPGENAAPYFASSFTMLAYAYPPMEDAIEAVMKKGWPALPEGDRTELQTWLKDQQLVFDLASKGAERPWCRYERQWWSDRERKVEMEPWRVPVSEVEGVAQLSDALVVLAQSRMAEGKATEARDAIRVALAVADSLRDDPFLESQRYRAGRISSILEVVAECMPRAMTEEDVDAWMKIIPRPEVFDGCLERAGRWMLKERVNLFSGGPSRYWFWQRIYYRWGPMDFSELMRNRLADPLFETDAVRCLEETTRLVEIWSKPYIEAKPEADRLEQDWKSWRERSHPTAPLVWHVAPALRLERIQTARARCAMIRLGLEWEKARSKTGSYPKVVDAIDPMTGRPFQLEEGPPRLTGAGLTGRRSEHRLERLPDRKGVITVPIAEPNTWILRQ